MAFRRLMSFVLVAPGGIEPRYQDENLVSEPLDDGGPRQSRTMTSV